MKKNNNKKITVIAIITFLVISVLCTAKVFQNDTFYTIKVGESIMKYGVDMLEHFSWIQGLPYVYPHWLYDVIIYNIYNIGGLFGIYVSTIVLFFILLVTIFIVNSKLNKNYLVSFIMTLCAAFLIIPFATARAQLVSYILFVLEIYSIEKLLKTNNKKYIFYLMLISLAIANIHAAVFPMIFVLFLPYIAAYFVPKIFFKKNNLDSFVFAKVEIVKIKKISPLIIAMVLCILMGFITPIGLTPFTYFIKIQSGITISFIMEHQPITIVLNPAIYIIAFVLLIIYGQNKTRIKSYDVFMILGLLLMSFLSIRNASFIYTVAIIPITRMILTTIGEDFLKKLNKNKLLNIVIFPTLLIVVILIVFSYFRYIYKSDFFIDEKTYPIAASDYILENIDINEMRLFNGYTQGSYLLYRNIPVFIDSRSDLYTPEFSGKEVTIISDYINIKREHKRIFEKYDITHALIEKDSDLDYLLREDDNCTEIYKDNYFVLYAVNY